jgi:hypothetical protein
MVFAIVVKFSGSKAKLTVQGSMRNAQ